jgi:hypothetical protein
MELEDAPLRALPELLERNLRRARHLHNRGMRARYDSNERSTCLAVSRELIGEAMTEAAAEGIPLRHLPEWARQFAA